MADFDPDAYLANPAPAGSSGGFDPDAYLKGSSAPPKGDFGWSQLATDIPSEIGNEFSAGMKTAAEGFEAPKPGVSGALENLGKTAMAPLGMGRAAFSWLTGPVKSVVGHGMANAEHLVGENVVNPIAKNVFGVPEEKLQHPDPNEMYETAKGDVDKALSAARPAGAPIKGPTGWSWDHPPAPPTTGPKPIAPVVQAADRISAIAPEPIDVPKAFASDSTAVQRVGQTLRNLPIIGDAIPEATGKMAGQLEGAHGAIASNYGQGSGPNVASRVGATISNAADAERAAAEQDALNSNTSVLNAWQRAQDDALHQVATDENTALTQARAATGNMTPQEMGQQIITNLRRTEREAQNRKNDLYNTADQLGASVQANAVRGVHGFVSDVLTQEGRMSPLTNQMDPMLNPASHSMMQELRGLSDAMAPVRDPETGRFSRPPPVSVRQLEQIRKRLGNIAQSANNDGDRAAARIIMNSFDGWEGHAFDNALFSGSPDALNAVREARAANRSWRQGFYNDRDDADKIINKVVTGEVTPQEMSNWLVGSSQVGAPGTSSRMLTRIAQVTNGDPATMDTIRAGVANRLFGTTEGTTPRAPERIASDIHQFFNGTGGDVARRLFTPPQRQAALNYANAVRRAFEDRESIRTIARTTQPSEMPADVGPMQELAQAVLGKNGKTDEALFNAIDNYARSGGKGDIQTLGDILRTIPAKDKGDLAGAIVRNLGQSEQTKGFSLDKFATDWGKYTPQAKDLLFGNAGQHRQALDDIATISQRYKEVGRRFGNPSGTGQTVGGMGELLWIVFHPFTAIPTLAGGAVAARMLSAPASARQTATLMSRALDMAKSQTAGNAARLNFAWNNFAKSAVNFGASPGILRFTQGGPQGPGTSNAKDNGRIHITPGKAKGGTVTDPVDELADEMIQDAKRFAGFKKGGSPASFDERWDAAYPFGQLSPNIEDRRNSPEFDPEKNWPKYPPRPAQSSEEPITPLGDQMGAGVLDKQLPGFADGGTPTADPTADPAFGNNSLVDQAHTQLNTQAERLPPPMSDEQVMNGGQQEAPDDRPQWIQKLADNTSYQPWWNRVAMSGATLAHDVMTGQEPMLMPGMRREMYTDVPPPTGPTEDSTWLGKKLGLPPVAWDPNDPVIERAQDMAALAGTGGLGNAEEGAVLNATPSLRPALKYEGKIYKAPPNGEHLDALPAHLQGEFQRQAMSGEDISNFQFGFMNHKGQFLNRDQALDYGLKEGLIDPRDARYGTLTSTMLSDTSKPGAAMSALEGESRGIQGINGEEHASPFYSAVEKTVDNSPQSKMQGTQWANWLKNQPGVKQEELEWSGLDNWLRSQKDPVTGKQVPVTKEQVQGYLKQNPTEIKDVTHGKMPEKWNDVPDHLKRAAQDKFEELNGRFPRGNELPVWYESIAKYGNDGNETALSKTMNDTQYGNWQLPGGQNYREHLLTLPDRSEAQLLREEAERRGYGDKISQWPDKEFAQRYRDKVTNATDTGTYKSKHWDEPNVLAHVRTNDRQMPEEGYVVRNKASGNTSEVFPTKEAAQAAQKNYPQSLQSKLELVPTQRPVNTLHLEEIQSDWHQAGRKNGYAQDIPQVQAYYETNGQRVPIGGGKTEAEALASSGDWPKTLEQIGLPIKYETTYRKGPGVPDAPFKTSWPELSLKRMVRMAAEEGKDRISWTPGEAQAARYNLSKQVDDIRVNKGEDGNYSLSYTPKGDKNFRPMTDKPVPAEKLPDYIGKDLAEKIVQDKSIDRLGTGTLSGEDLKVGGEGMKGFYDQMLPKIAEKMGKQYGVKVHLNAGKVGRSLEDELRNRGLSMESFRELPLSTRNRILEKVDEGKPVHYFDIPPKMKEDALKKGFSLFSDSSKPGAAVAGAEGSQNSSLWHGISQIKLPKPISEMSAVHTATGPSGERIIRPADLQGGNLLPLMGDRSGAGSMLHQVNGTPFQNPVEMQGGHGFMPANAETGAAWASAKPMASGIANRVKKLGEDNPTYGMYTAMGERSIDFSHHMSDTLAEMLKGAKITKDNKAAFDRAMRTDNKDFKAVSDWPGVGSKKLREYLANSPGNTKSKFAKLMDSRTFQDAGFPSVAEARFATTDPRLLHQPTGASGLAVAKMDPSGRIFETPDQHRTYESNVAGSYVGGLPTSVPKEIMYPKMIKSLENYRDNLPGYKPTTDYLMARTPKGLPVTEPADQQWVDSVSQWLKERGYSGLKQGGAANNKENIPGPVKAERAENVPARARGGRIEASNINHSPSEAQKEAGNYSKDHVNIHGLSFTVENAKGKHRSGIGKDGKEWKVKMPAHYGYIKRTEGADGDHVDVYLGPHLKSDKVFIVNQRDAESKKFDEHKCLLGFGSLRQALETYNKGFSDGKGLQRIDTVHEISMADFKKWLKSGDTTLPFGSEHKPNIAEERYAKIISTHHAHTEEPWKDYVPAAKAVLEVR